MTAVGFQDAARYALKLFGYLLAVVVVATGAISIGYWLVRPEISPALGQGTAEKAPLVGGSVLIVIGAAILSIGTISAVYKLLADAVHTGGGTAARATASAVPAAEPTGDREATPVQTGAQGAAADRAETGKTDAAAAASERARAAQAEVDQDSDETVAATRSAQADSGAALDGDDTTDVNTADEEGVSIGSQADRETNPVPSESETSPDPPDRETTPEPPDRETSPDHPDRETNPEPPSDAGEEADRPEPSAEEIAFGSSGGADSASEAGGEDPESSGGTATGDDRGGAAGRNGPSDDAESMFSSKSVPGDEDAADESLDPMWSDETAGEGEAGSSGDESDDAGAGPEEAPGFDEPPIEEDVEPAGTADRDPLADEE
jgi:hypothetical protein